MKKLLPIYLTIIFSFVLSTCLSIFIISSNENKADFDKFGDCYRDNRIQCVWHSSKDYGLSPLFDTKGKWVCRFNYDDMVLYNGTIKSMCALKYNIDPDDSKYLYYRDIEQYQDRKIVVEK